MALVNEKEPLTDERKKSLDSETGTCEKCGNAFMKGDPIDEFCYPCRILIYAEKHNLDSSELFEFLEV